MTWAFYLSSSLWLAALVSPLAVPVAFVFYAAMRRRFSLLVTFILITAESVALIAFKWANSFRPFD